MTGADRPRDEEPVARADQVAASFPDDRAAGPAEQEEPLAAGAAGTPAVTPRLTRRDRIRNRAVALAGLVVVWCLLWGSFSWANIVGGLVLAVIILMAFPLPPVTFAGRIHPLGLLRFLLRFFSDLVVSSIEVALLAFRFGHTVRSAVIAVPLRVGTDLNLTLTGVALSLVPGSLIIEVDRTAGILYVHVLNVYNREEVEHFRRGVYELEARIIGAIGSDAERRAVAEQGIPGPVPPADGKGASA